MSKHFAMTDEQKFADAEAFAKSCRDQPEHLPPFDAFAAIRQAIRNDPGYAWSWHCNIAMAAQDEGMSHAAANRAAARFMKSFFEVTTIEPRSAPEPKSIELAEDNPWGRARVLPLCRGGADVWWKNL